MKFTRALVASILIVSASACSSASSNTSTDATPNEVTLLAYDAFTPTDGIFDAFTAATGATVKVITGGDSGVLISKAILTAGTPEGDVLWGLDNTLLSRAKKAELLTSYEPVDTGDICVNYDKQWFASRNIAPPTSLDDLTLPAYKGLLVTQDPVASSPGLGFLLGTIAHFGYDDWQDEEVERATPLADVSVGEILEQAIGVEPGRWTKSDQMRVGAYLKAAKWERYQRRGDGIREWRYRRS